MNPANSNFNAIGVAVLCAAFIYFSQEQAQPNVEASVKISAQAECDTCVNALLKLQGIARELNFEVHVL